MLHTASHVRLPSTVDLEFGCDHSWHRNTVPKCTLEFGGTERNHCPLRCEVTTRDENVVRNDEVEAERVVGKCEPRGIMLRTVLAKPTPKVRVLPPSEELVQP